MLIIIVKWRFLRAIVSDWGEGLFMYENYELIVYRLINSFSVLVQDNLILNPDNVTRTPFGKG
jgi:hypothetical protein